MLKGVSQTLFPFYPMKNSLGLAVVLGGAQAMGSPAVSAFVEPVLVREVAPSYPLQVSSEGRYEGRVRALVEVDQNGKVADWLAVSATDERFLRPIEAVIHSWHFEPARDGGEAVPSGVEVDFRFEYSNALFQLNSIQTTGAYLNQLRSVREAAWLTEVAALDGPLVPVATPRPLLAAGVEGADRLGEALFTFLIDREGRVRMPVLVELEGDERLAQGAYVALKEWRFEPPRRGGEPVIVRVSQRFRFTE